jgi:hypothetical protein
MISPEQRISFNLNSLSAQSLGVEVLYFVSGKEDKR